MSDVRLFIDGTWREGLDGRDREVINPATEEPAGRVACAGEQDVSAALHAANAALPVWRDAGADRRAAVLRGAATKLADRCEAAAVTLTTEQGKTLAESRAEFARAIETLAWHADAAASALEPQSGAGRSEVVLPEPIGVVGAFTPWNYPAVIVARKLGGALAAGCTVVLKAAEETPSAAACIVAALEEAGLPPGVVNLVFGDPPAIANQVLSSPVVRAFSFTGSTAVGKQLAERAAHTLTRSVLELGGHAPVLVFADADLPAAVEAIAAYKFECAGQSCNAPSRIYVAEPVYRRFVDEFVAVAEGLRVGNGSDRSTTMGPMANARRIAAMQRLTDDARARGARMLTGGERLDRRGYFWSPTVVVDLVETATLMTEEPFGPIVPILPFSTFGEGVARANATPFGLTAYAFTGSASVADAAARALAAGSVGINELRGVPPDVGIAGIKDSGYGYEGGQRGIEAFLNLKVVRGRRP